MVVRALAALFAVWVAQQSFGDLSGGIYEALTNGAVGTLILAVVTHLPLILLAVVTLLGSRALANWIVPYPAREATCPQCGYSLKNLKSPICPECGADFK